MPSPATSGTTFSSQSYKTLTPVGTVAIADPFTGQKIAYGLPGGGRGYTRVPSLISLWSTAPFLLNNTVGPFDGNPGVANRYASYRASIEQMLWPERRQADSELGAAAGGLIDRTSQRTYLFVPKAFLGPLQGLLTDEDKGLLRELVDANGDLVLGPIPKGMPINLLASLQPLAESRDPKLVAGHYHQVIAALVQLKRALIANKGKTLSDPELRASFARLRAPLMKLSKCPDFRGQQGPLLRHRPVQPGRDRGRARLGHRSAAR